MSQENVEIVRAAIDAFNRGDVDAAFKDVIPDFEYDQTRAVGMDRGVEVCPACSGSASSIEPRSLACASRSWRASDNAGCTTTCPREPRVEHMADERLLAAFRLAATTGLQRGELLGLRWRDVDLEAARVSVVQTLVGKRQENGEWVPVFSLPKTERGRRNIALDPETVAVLRDYRKRQLEERMALGPAYRDSELVFCREDGVPLWPTSFSRTFERQAKAAGLPVIRLHDFCATRTPRLRCWPASTRRSFQSGSATPQWRSRLTPIATRSRPCRRTRRRRLRP